MAEQMEEAYPNIKVHVYPIVNYFFGEKYAQRCEGQSYPACKEEINVAKFMY